MKETGIIFGAFKVRAILDRLGPGQEMQTRRIIRGQAPVESGTSFSLGAFCSWVANDVAVRERWTESLRCPYGGPGDRLWVRETFLGGKHEGDTIWYRASEPERIHGSVRWTSPIHMPRRTSRITVELTGVHVERLQDISEEDARTEGVSPREGIGGFNVFTEDGGSYWTNKEPVRGEDGVRDFVPAKPMLAASARDVFVELWDSLNGKRGPWRDNPWVWVLTFKRVTEDRKVA